MKFKKLKIEGAYLIEFDELKDERGSFTRQFCKKELSEIGIDFDIKQANISKNYKKGVLRGLHYQDDPYLENKIVTCLSGSYYDVILDLRKDSNTYLQWESVILSSEKCNAIYIPAKCAHGFFTLEDNTTLYYQLDEYFMPEHYKGVRYNDPKLDIAWPECENLIMNERDKNYPLL